MATILETVKTICNVSHSESVFDAELLLHINGTISSLQNLGVNNISTFVVEEATDYPALVEGEGEEMNRLLQIYIPLKVKIVFDSSSSATISSAHNMRVGELEQQIMFACSEEVLDE